MLATEACLAELPAIPERDKELEVGIRDSVPMDPTGETTTSIESTAWVGGMWRTSTSVNPSNGELSDSDIRTS